MRFTVSPLQALTAAHSPLLQSATIARRRIHTEFSFLGAYNVRIRHFSYSEHMTKRKVPQFIRSQRNAGTEVEQSHAAVQARCCCSTNRPEHVAANNQCSPVESERTKAILVCRVRSDRRNSRLVSICPKTPLDQRPITWFRPEFGQLVTIYNDELRYESARFMDTPTREGYLVSQSLTHRSEHPNNAHFPPPSTEPFATPRALTLIDSADSLTYIDCANAAYYVRQ